MNFHSPCSRSITLVSAGPPRDVEMTNDQEHTMTDVDTADNVAEPLNEEQIKMALRRVKDPELNLNIVDLGLV